MRLKDLHPQWNIGPNGQKYLEFDCPKCLPQGNCILSIPVTPRVNESNAVWDMSGEDFDTLTISPSVFHHCKSEAHFFIQNGEIKLC